MKYKVGDKVRIKNLDWYNENKDEYGYIDCGSRAFFTKMSDWCGKIATIKEICKTNCYRLEEYDFDWTDEMIEELVEEETLIERVDDNGLPFNEWLSHKGAFYIPDGYELKDENGNEIRTSKIILEKKKKEVTYPKTYAECCKILGFINVDLCFNADYRSFDASKEQWKRLGLMNQFYQLLICRDAYWKIAGEEIGLGKPWEPDWLDDDTKKYVITSTKVFGTFGGLGYINYILTFPTEEMRDAFYENFKELIEQCKELL